MTTPTRGTADGDYGVLEELGQEPFSPPNVAGWPAGPRWLSAGATLARVQYASDAAADSEVVSTSDPVGDILAKASLYEVSVSTVAALKAAVAGIEGRRDRASARHALVAVSPEFCVA